MKQAIDIAKRLEERGMRGAVIPVSHIAEVRDEFLERYRRGEFEKHFYDVELTSWKYDLPKEPAGIASLIIVASPQPQIRCTFALDGRSYGMLIPPTYSYATDRAVRGLLEELLRPHGWGVTKAKIPLKLLAARSGLSRYGRNNITYVPGLGSFQRLAAFYTDMPCGLDPWGDPRELKHCESCAECVKACPTRAIDADRFLLHAERCITFLNEFPGAFPEWLDPKLHHSVVGCLYCQKCCPVNARVVDWIVDGDSFSEEETRLLLGGVTEDRLSAETAAKLDRLCLTEYLALLPRNLGAVLRAAGASSLPD